MCTVTEKPRWAERSACVLTHQVLAPEWYWVTGSSCSPAGAPVRNKQMSVLIKNVLNEAVKTINCIKPLSAESPVFLLSNLFFWSWKKWSIRKVLCCPSQLCPEDKAVTGLHDRGRKPDTFLHRWPFWLRMTDLEPMFIRVGRHFLKWAKWVGPFKESRQPYCCQWWNSSFEAVMRILGNLYLPFWDCQLPGTESLVWMRSLVIFTSGTFLLLYHTV